jgi:hypothetical protein
VPRHIGLIFFGAELAEQQDGERRGADPVGVVVPVHADAGAGLDRGGDRLDRLAHVAEGKRVVARERALQEPPRLVGRPVPAPDEHRGRHLIEGQLGGESAHLLIHTWIELPSSGRHRADHGTERVGRNMGG